MKLIKALNKPQFIIIEQLAKQIWQEHYSPIIGAEQVCYMLEKFQSADTMMQQLNDGRQYYLICNDHQQNAGYLAYDIDNAKQQLFLSKIYVHSDFRGQGLAKAALTSIRQEFSDLDIVLTVNKENHIAIDFYLSQGFIKRREVVADIGNGFVMDDYEMLLSRQTQ